jgi:DNA-binding NarL/FixJ family response regulator
MPERGFGDADQSLEPFLKSKQDGMGMGLARALKEYLGKFALLTRRERQVLRGVAVGRQNKQIAFDLGVSEISVKLYRGAVMRKMQLTSVGELVRLWETLPAEVRDGMEA